MESTNTVTSYNQDKCFRAGKHFNQVCFALLKHELKNRSAMHII